MVPYNFGGLEKQYTDYTSAKIVIFPVPYAGTITYGSGAEKGPDAIIYASLNMELLDIETRSEVYRQGIFTAPALKVTNKTKPEVVVDAVHKQVRAFLEHGKFVVMLGGEHSISTGMARALHEKYKIMSVLHLDAHGDTRESYLGSKYNHACVIARIRKFAPVVQVGIRSIDVEEIHIKQNQRIFFAHEMHKNTDWVQKAVDALTNDVFITIDLDVLDPTYMPSVGTPEPGGLEWYTLITFLEKVIQQKNVVGFDIVELAPQKNLRAPDFLAAKLIYRLLSMRFAKKRMCLAPKGRNPIEFPSRASRGDAPSGNAAPKKSSSGISKVLNTYKKA